MKVLHISETMASGVLKYIQEVIQADGEAVNEHYIVYSGKRKYTPQNLKELFPDSVRLINVDINIRHGLLGSIRFLFKQIRAIDPDIIHLHSSIAGFIGRLIAIFLPKIRVYYTPHGYSFLMTNKPIWIRASFWIVEFVMSQFRGNIVACSKSECRYAEKLSPLRKVYLVENCIKASADNQPQDHAFPSHKQVIGVGRMEQQKNPRLFVEIAAQLRRLDPSVRAVWIGDGSLRAECERVNDALQGGVEFKGWLSHEETLDHIGNSSVFLQTSNWEGLPYSVLEAFAAGVPVVASNISSHRDIIGESYLGYIAENFNDYIEFSTKLLNDRELSSHIKVTNLIRLVENYGFFAERVHNIYKTH